MWVKWQKFAQVWNKEYYFFSKTTKGEVVVFCVNGKAWRNGIELSHLYPARGNMQNSRKWNWHELFFILLHESFRYKNNLLQRLPHSHTFTHSPYLATYTRITCAKIGELRSKLEKKRERKGRVHLSEDIRKQTWMLPTIHLSCNKEF